MKWLILMLLSLITLEMKSQNTVNYLPCSQCNMYYMELDMMSGVVSILDCVDPLAFDPIMKTCNWQWSIGACIHGYDTDVSLCHPERVEAEFNKQYISSYESTNCVKEVTHSITVQDENDVNFLASIGIHALIGETVYYITREFYTVTSIDCMLGGNSECTPVKAGC